MLTTIISRLGLPLLVSVIAGALGKVDNDVAQNASKVLGNLEGAMAGGVISSEQLAEANRHAEEVARLKSQEYETILSEINQTIRAEAASSDIYVRRMRPTFGYLMAITWAAQMLGIAYIMIFETEKAPDVLDAMEALSAIWAIGLSVLGIYVYKRSEEKKVSLPPKREVAPSPEVVKTTNIKPQNATAVRPKVNE
ncbi:MAG: ribokinase [Micavibrio aeruginosavorus]|uniref:Ribokinase n=1 Tax=Micavibrio aeruginosavorus TaxID=349221 RepID=A0A2W5A536_9BACT|nr:MAG: ribokinase [Micavibrio aeruginosavorus]